MGAAGLPGEACEPLLLRPWCLLALLLPPSWEQGGLCLPSSPFMRGLGAVGTVLGLHRVDEGIPESRAGCEWKATGRRDAEMQRGGPSQACVALGHRAVRWGLVVLSQVTEPPLNAMRFPPTSRKS